SFTSSAAIASRESWSRRGVNRRAAKPPTTIAPRIRKRRRCRRGRLPRAGAAVGGSGAAGSFDKVERRADPGSSAGDWRDCGGRPRIPEEEAAHVLLEDLLRLRIHEVQAQLVDHHHLV